MPVGTISKNFGKNLSEIAQNRSHRLASAGPCALSKASTALVTEFARTGRNTQLSQLRSASRALVGAMLTSSAPARKHQPFQKANLARPVAAIAVSDNQPLAALRGRKMLLHKDLRCRPPEWQSIQTYNNAAMTISAADALSATGVSCSIAKRVSACKSTSRP